MYATRSPLPSTLALSAAVLPSESLSVRSAPCSSRTRTVSRRLKRAARCSAVHNVLPGLLVAFTLHPRSMTAAAASGQSWRLAIQISTVQPSLSQ